MCLDDADIATLGDGGFVIRDGHLGAEAEGVAAAARELVGTLRPAGIGHDRRHVPTTRGDRISWIDPAAPPPGLAPLVDRFAALRVALNAAAYLGLRRFELQLASYPGGGARYERHRDALRGSDARVVTAIHYLNAGWTAAQGGVLRLHMPGGPVDVDPLFDRLLLFLSDRVEHEVLPAHAERLAITAWYRRDLP